MVIIHPKKHPNMNTSQVISISSCISASQKACRWRLALELLQQAERHNIDGNLVTFNAAMAASVPGFLVGSGGSTCDLKWVEFAVKTWCFLGIRWCNTSWKPMESEEKPRKDGQFGRGWGRNPSTALPQPRYPCLSHPFGGFVEGMLSE